jgi:hypothetical protein
MYLKIILKHLSPNRVVNDQILYFEEDLPQVCINQAEEIIANLDLKLIYIKELRFQNIFEQDKMVGMLVSIVSNF